MKHKIILFLAAICLLFGCTKNETKKPVTMVFLPNESSDAMKDARQAFMEIISEAVHSPRSNYIRKCRHGLYRSRGLYKCP